MQLRIVGVVLVNNGDTSFADWASLSVLAPGTRAQTYQVQLVPGADHQTALAALAVGDPGLVVMPPRDTTSDQAVVLIGSATILTVVLGAVAYRLIAPAMLWAAQPEVCDFVLNAARASSSATVRAAAAVGSPGLSVISSVRSR